MEDLLKQILENQAITNRMVANIQETQIQMIKDIETLKQNVKRLDERIDNLERRMEEQFKEVNERIDDLEQRTDNRFEEIKMEMNKRFEEINEKVDNLEKKTDNHFIKLEKYLDENLSDIAFIFQQYNSRFIKMNEARKINGI